MAVAAEVNVSRSVLVDLPPFGVVYAKNEYEGYDVDVAKLMATMTRPRRRRCYRTRSMRSVRIRSLHDQFFAHPRSERGRTFLAPILPWPETPRHGGAKVPGLVPGISPAIHDFLYTVSYSAEISLFV